MAKRSAQFDAAYYQRYYLDPETRAASPAEQRRQGQFIAAYLKYLDLPIERIVDLGCGLGTLLKQVGKQFAGAQCVGVELSEHLCETLAWQQGSVVDFHDDPFDLVICADVLGYLNNRDCARAINNLANLCDGALYLSVITAEDLSICDTEHTDMQQSARPVEWYRKRLQRHFVNAGGGLYLRKPLQVPLWRLEYSQQG